MRWLQDFITEVACCLKLRWESKLTPRSFRAVEEGRRMLAMFIEDGREVCWCANKRDFGFLRVELEKIDEMSVINGTSFMHFRRLSSDQKKSLHDLRNRRDLMTVW